VIELRERDVKLALELVYDAGAYNGTDPFPPDFLVRLAGLIPSDVLVGYHEAVLGNPCRVVEAREVPEEGIPAEAQEAGGRFRHQDPIRHSIRRQELRALKLSDFFTQRQLQRLDFYWYVWRPAGIHDSLRVWLPAPCGRARVVYLERSRRNFTERERSLLELLRPTLIKMHTRATTQRRQASAGANSLTERETNILRLIAAGNTTREIAAILVVSPHTVRKHIEHILEKLDVRTRSAAVARAFQDHAA
jgi:DNA-binding CsgD family transcriptional regulator